MAQNFATALSAAAEKLSSDLNTNFVTLDSKTMKNALDIAAQNISEHTADKDKVASLDSQFPAALSAAAAKLSADFKTNFVILEANTMKNSLNAAAQSISEQMPEKKKSFTKQISTERTDLTKTKEPQR